MPLPDIQLDDRRFKDLYAEARRRIPAYTPEWTDHNDSDPGITLLQLFAWLEETIIWRLNRVPQKNFLKFLEMVGISLNPPAPAKAELTFKLSSKDLAEAVVIPQGTRVSLSESVDGQPVIFEIDDNLLAVGADLAAVQSYNGAQYQLQTEAARVAGASFYAFGSEPDAGAALYLGFDRAFPPGRQRITFHMTPPGGNPVAQGGSTKPADISPPVMAVWEYWAGTQARWQPVTVVSDETVALSRTGILTFEAPSNAQAAKYGALQKQDDPALYWLRLRIVELLGAGYEAPPQVEDVLLNTITATNAVTEVEEILGASDSRPNQVFYLAKKPVLPKDPDVPGIIAVNEGSGYEVWKEVKDFAGAGREDKVYTLNLTTGDVRFGDGEHGKIPRWLSGDASNSEAADIPNIKATRYRWGGGARGNAGAKKITSLETAVPFVESVTNYRASFGGQDEEPVDAAQTRGPMALRTQMRAVTPDDFAFLAQQTPGARIRRAQALPLHHPRYELARASAVTGAVTEVPIPGVVTVVVVPESPNPKPVPSAETLRLVAEWLDKHRLVTCELYVIGPTYRKVQVQARVIAAPSAAAGPLQQTLETKLLNYFHPLLGGNDGKGWKFGDTIYFSEVFRQILVTDGVLRIEAGGVKIFLDDEQQNSAQDIPLRADELVYSLKHTVIVSYS
jgi:predicted phage baseplate assembly protein